MQQLLSDNENCAMSLNINMPVSEENRNGTSPISFLGALRIPVSTGIILIPQRFGFWLTEFIFLKWRMDETDFPF